MATLSSKELNEKPLLQPVAASGRLGGFNNLLGKEFSQWWGTNMWWIQILIWVLILNGITTIVALTENLTPEENLQEVIQTFFPMSVGAIGLGIVITVQGAIVGEKQLGTAAWVMSKPASRTAFILSKFIAYAFDFGVTAIAIPTLIFFITTRLLIPVPLALMPFLASVGIVILSMLFYLALTLMLGTIFNSRGPVTGIGVGVILFGLLLKGFIPPVILLLTPWVLPDLSGALALSMPLPPNWYLSVVVTAFLIILFIFVAFWRFSHEEF